MVCIYIFMMGYIIVIGPLSYAIFFVTAFILMITEANHASECPLNYIGLFIVMLELVIVICLVVCIIKGNEEGSSHSRARNESPFLWEVRRPNRVDTLTVQQNNPPIQIQHQRTAITQRVQVSSNEISDAKQRITDLTTSIQLCKMPREDN